MQGLRRSFLSLGNDPALKVLLEEDKDVIQAVSTLGKEVLESATYLRYLVVKPDARKYGDTQHFDLRDITDHLFALSKGLEKSLGEFNTAYQGYRENLKAIKKKQDELHDLESKSKTAADKLKKAKAGGKPFDMLEREGRLSSLTTSK
ncbi:hypothetical protein HDU91_006426 [Kappamyces sp. JEL0680]|nr:hypothetical protein HDU91_006426 [Kappamyces sp. JEL0680]